MDIHHLSKVNIIHAIKYRFFIVDASDNAVLCRICGAKNKNGMLIHEEDCLAFRAMECVSNAQERYEK